mmetsp:Transcript_45881/g.121274  ORF Transcript_45881/g.121274 Transcript_45881/m.121274 type:complete len:356 (+) Transcript_45881:2805-3872(+)
MQIPCTGSTHSSFSRKRSLVVGQHVDVVVHSLRRVDDPADGGMLSKQSAYGLAIGHVTFQQRNTGAHGLQLIHERFLEFGYPSASRNQANVASAAQNEALGNQQTNSAIATGHQKHFVRRQKFQRLQRGRHRHSSTQKSGNGDTPIHNHCLFLTARNLLCQGTERGTAGQLIRDVQQPDPNPGRLQPNTAEETPHQSTPNSQAPGHRRNCRANSHEHHVGASPSPGGHLGPCQQFPHTLWDSSALVCILRLLFTRLGHKNNSVPRPQSCSALRFFRLQGQRANAQSRQDASNGVNTGTVPGNDPSESRNAADILLQLTQVDPRHTVQKGLHARQQLFRCLPPRERTGLDTTHLRR